MFNECNKITSDYNSPIQLFAMETHSPTPAVSLLEVPSKKKKVSFFEDLVLGKPQLFPADNKNCGTKIFPNLEFPGRKNENSLISTLSAAAKTFYPKNNTTSFNPSTPSQQLPQSSIWGEIFALKDFLQTTLIEDKILVWVSDSLDAVYDVNKGRCGSEQDAETLRAIFYHCDKKRLQLIAIWVPRELNIMADYLSHLSTYINRDICGNLSDLVSTSKN
jgi:hypothetical protein